MQCRDQSLLRHNLNTWLPDNIPMKATGNSRRGRRSLLFKASRTRFEGPRGLFKSTCWPQPDRQTIRSAYKPQIIEYGRASGANGPREKRSRSAYAHGMTHVALSYEVPESEERGRLTQIRRPKADAHWHPAGKKKRAVT